MELLSRVTLELEKRLFGHVNTDHYTATQKAGAILIATGQVETVIDGN